MNYKITKPDGETITITGNKVCRSSKPDCEEVVDPGFIPRLVDHAWHEGWQVESKPELVDVFLD